VSKTATLTAELQAHLKAARDIASAAEAEDRDFTDDERASVVEAMDKAKGVKARLEQAKADQDMLKAVAELGEGIGLSEPEDRPSPFGYTGSGLVVPDGKSLGELFVESAEYKDLLATAPGGVFTKDHRVQGRPVGVKSLLGKTHGKAYAKTLITGADDTSAGSLVQPDYRGLLVGMDTFQRPLNLRNVVTPGNTSSDTVEYVRVTSTSNSAAPVPEATETGGTSGTKPESGFTTLKIVTPVRTIAHWVPATKRALSDASQVRSLIDGFLLYGLEEELEDQMISGDGTGENLEGLANVSGVQVQPFDGQGNALALLRTLRKAKTKVRTIGRSVPNAYVLNPEDVERIDLTVDGMNRFYFGGPVQAGGTPPLWGLPVVESEAVPPGTGYVGDWRKAILWDREQGSLTATDSHADFFIRNMIAILAEARAAFGIIQPSAFVEIQLEPTAPAAAA
jgi:HK97 family phage major capsid protein